MRVKAEDHFSAPGHKDKINRHIPDWVRLLLCKAPVSAHAQNASAQTRLDHTHKHHSATTHISWQKFNRVPDSPPITRHSALWYIFRYILNMYSFLSFEFNDSAEFWEKRLNGMEETPSLTRTIYIYKWRFNYSTMSWVIEMNKIASIILILKL